MNNILSEIVNKVNWAYNLTLGRFATWYVFNVETDIDWTNPNVPVIRHQNTNLANREIETTPSAAGKTNVEQIQEDIDYYRSSYFKSQARRLAQPEPTDTKPKSTENTSENYDKQYYTWLKNTYGQEINAEQLKEFTRERSRLIAEDKKVPADATLIIYNKIQEFLGLVKGVSAGNSTSVPTSTTAAGDVVGRATTVNTTSVVLTPPVEGSLNQLPIEVLEKIDTYINLSDFFNMLLVSKEWRQAVSRLLVVSRLFLFLKVPMVDIPDNSTFPKSRFVVDLLLADQPINLDKKIILYRTNHRSNLIDKLYINIIPTGARRSIPEYHNIFNEFQNSMCDQEKRQKAVNRLITFINNTNLAEILLRGLSLNIKDIKKIILNTTRFDINIEFMYQYPIKQKDKEMSLNSMVQLAKDLTPIQNLIKVSTFKIQVAMNYESLGAIEASSFERKKFQNEKTANFNSFNNISYEDVFSSQREDGFRYSSWCITWKNPNNATV